MECYRDKATSSQPLPSPPPSRPETFWSSCNGCGLQYEYLKMYLNQNLICPNCLQSFLATEKPAPSSVKIHSTPGPWSVLQQQRQGIFAGTFTPSRVTPTAPLIQPAGESSKDGMKTVAMARSEEALQKNSSKQMIETKRRRIDGQKSKSTIDRYQMTAGSRSLQGNLEAERVNSASDKSTSRKKFSQAELRTLLMGRAKTEILEKLNHWGINAKMDGAK